MSTNEVLPSSVNLQHFDGERTPGCMMNGLSLVGAGSLEVSGKIGA
jgi:hypothetical protein